MGQKLGHGPSLLRIFDQAFVNEVAEVGRPVLGRYWCMWLANDSLELASLIQYICERGFAGGQLVGEAAESPHIDLFRVLDLLFDCDFWGVEGFRACLGLCREVRPLGE